jgi:hypothetical protein
MRMALIGNLNWGTEVLARLGSLERAAVWFGIVRVGPLEAGIGKYQLSPGWVESVEHIRHELGEQRFDELARRGAAMPYEEVVASLRELVDELRGATGVRS